MNTETMQIIKSDKLDDKTLRCKLIEAIDAEQAWGFDSVFQALAAILNHEDFEDRWESTEYTLDLAYTYRARTLNRLESALRRVKSI